ncbi:MAG: hypothetical protein IKW78_02610, partial [Prevotella sp.]|nr:hypothetical protein [Prevotella sp.]
ATGDGTRLQHILGNLFRQERLERMFDTLRLRQFVRAGEDFDIGKHKHIFIYALFGYVSTLDEDLRKWFIGKYIVNDETAYLFRHRQRNIDLLAQADEIVRRSDGRRLTLEMEVTDEGLNRAKAVLSDGSVLCEAVSKSWRYARTKATKMALNMLATPARKIMLSNPEYQARVQARIEEKKARRRAEIEERDAIKESLRAEKRERRKAMPASAMPSGARVRRRRRSARPRMPAVPPSKQRRKPVR